MYIYKITNRINNKIYIGLTTMTNPKDRFSCHISDALNSHKDFPLQRSIRKYGKKNFNFELIYYSFSFEDLNEKEIYFIKLYNSTNNKIGYNITTGGSCAKHTSESKLKIGKKSKGRKTFLNKKHSLESRIKMSESKKGIPCPQYLRDSRAKTYQLMGPYGNLITFKNLRKFCLDNKLCRSSIMKILKGKLTSYKGYRNKNFKVKKFKGVSPSGDIHIFTEQKELKQLGLTSSRVGEVLRGERNITKGWTFSYLSSDNSEALDII